MLITRGPGRGLVVNPSQNYAAKNLQKSCEDQYIIFNNKHDLLEWLKGLDFHDLIQKWDIKEGEKNMTIKATYFKPDTLTFSNLKELTYCHKHVGFEPNNDDTTERYMLVTCGSGSNLAVSPAGTWTAKEAQENYKSGYVIFNSKEDLLEWMKG